MFMTLPSVTFLPNLSLNLSGAFKHPHEVPRRGQGKGGNGAFPGYQSQRQGTDVRPSEDSRSSGDLTPVQVWGTAQKAGRCPTQGSNLQVDVHSRSGITPT